MADRRVDAGGRAYSNNDATVLAPDRGPVPLSRRPMFIDCVRKNNDGTHTQICLLYGISTAATDTSGLAYFVHGGRCNIAAFAGNVESVAKDEHNQDWAYSLGSTHIKLIQPQAYRTADLKTHIKGEADF